MDAALADAARRSGDWLVCRPGCTQCCVGVFPIMQSDAVRLRAALLALDDTDAASAQRIRTRVHESIIRIVDAFPGDATTGTLFAAESESAHEGMESAFEDYANDEPCPVLDPETGTCDLYAARPLPCRTFGPPVRNDEDGLAVCELCFHGATNQDIAACEMSVDTGALEDQLEQQAEQTTGHSGPTLIAFALRDV